MSREEQLNQWLWTAIQASWIAGKDILDVYESEDFNISEKEDQSPLTLADEKSHHRIVSFLKETGIPILSEEGQEIPYVERQSWKSLWIVDPLDGTKEFIKRNGEFTVNIALIENQKPVLGVIYVPVSKTLFFAHELLGSYACEKNHFTDLKSLISQSNKLPSHTTSQYTVVASRSHMSEETRQHIEELKNQHASVQLTSMGSSLKICLVAQGLANEYPRFAPTMEWDTAAGHAIAKYAGKRFIDHSLQEEMLYNRENLRNNWFLVK